MKNSFFSKTLLIVFLFGGLSANAQIRIKTNTAKGKKTIIKNTRKNNYNYRAGIRGKTNRYRVVANKPNRPKVIVKRPGYNKSGYVWSEGFWRWNAFYGRYTWQNARWIKVKRNHYWMPGYWGITAGGFFWTEGYWKSEF